MLGENEYNPCGECKAKGVSCPAWTRAASGIGIMAAILAARKICQLESTRPSPALHSIIADAVIFAERIMQRSQRARKDGPPPARWRMETAVAKHGAPVLVPFSEQARFSR